MWQRWLNLSLLVLFPVAWFAPLIRAGINLPLLGLKDVSVASGLVALWEEDLVLFTVVFLFALLAPALKVLGIALLHAGRLGAKAKTVFVFLGRVAMADIFLMALYVVIVKGVAVTRIEVGWGLYLFTFCVLASLAVSFFPGTKR
ncbi:paraquat-inducible protein A [Maritimibacter sp. DP1N21-5]|uniref:paraquat-inducible protein A n=1 Tax=Maritimibacter sp. DP1N21-5 TaxID=2836867 RepID=UPI001C459DD1|nr:paraquat-inducible protein A [Maritimibacter sp. DP1N21-5]MBV7410017.1 paraquat-inducible protein A [Maritimibacter sp. DP1N21-5]